MILKDSPKHLKHIPVQIVQRMVDIAESQGFAPEDVLYNERRHPKNWFVWEDTPEKSGFWKAVLGGNYEMFFVRYPPVTVSDLSGQISNLRVEVVQRMCEHQVNQGNDYDPTVFQEYKSEGRDTGLGFRWADTTEGEDLWRSVIVDGDHSAFFKFRDSKPVERVNEEPISLPMIMQVSNHDDFRDVEYSDLDKNYRTVLAKVDGGFIALGRTCSVEDVQNNEEDCSVTFWKYARVPPKVNISLAEIESRLGFPTGVIRIV